MKLPLLVNHAPAPMPLHPANLPSPTELHTPTVCILCGRGPRDCRVLVRSQPTGVFICDDCVRELSAELAAREERR